MMASGAPVIGSDGAGSFFYAETLPFASLELQKPWEAFLKNVVRVHRLREVTCLYGFTRLEPPPTSSESELDEIQLAVNGADLARNVEQFGEGIFLHVAPEFLKRWLESDEIAAMAVTLRERERRDAERSVSIARRYIGVQDTGRSIRCRMLSWRSSPWNAAIRFLP
jgi:hypothetical protein